MERLKYIVEDSTIAELLGVQNFTNKESAILELVKNSYDSRAKKVTISFNSRKLYICDNGIGMDEETILKRWMHVGKSDKGYSVIDETTNEERILSGSKGIGRFALARLGSSVIVYSSKEKSKPVLWTTNWDESILDDWNNRQESFIGTRIEISGLRDNWTKRSIENLAKYLSTTYNDDKMCIEVKSVSEEYRISRYFKNPELGKNCVSKIALKYNSQEKKLYCTINSDEFNSEAKKYCPNIDLRNYQVSLDMLDELTGDKEIDLSNKELSKALELIGDFSSELYFSLKSSTSKEIDNFLYKYDSLSSRYDEGVVLYRNAFSISSFEGQRDWLGFGKRSRKSPAAATHPSGSWRVRENQISGKVIIDKKANQELKDLSNRQGLEENEFYKIFVKILISGVETFERYRQSIIRAINKKNKSPEEATTSLINKLLKNPEAVKKFTEKEVKELGQELSSIKKQSRAFKDDKKTTEEKYIYDVRILNVLATSGLKATSIAHELKNDRNSVSVNYDYIVSALKEYDIWEDLNLPEYTEHSYNNVPLLLERNKNISEKILVFMDTMLDEVEKRKFKSRSVSIFNILDIIRSNWMRDYGCLQISLDICDDLNFETSEDIFTVIFDNLILNSLQQNENKNTINITISIKKQMNRLDVFYCDDGIGLPQKYINDPMRILAVHETSRENGHGLGMWIVNNTVLMTGGVVNKIDGNSGFKIFFELGGKL